MYTSGTATGGKCPVEKACGRKKFTRLCAKRRKLRYCRRGAQLNNESNVNIYVGESVGK